MPGMGFFNRIADCPELLLLCLIYRILKVFPDDWHIGRNLDNVHSVDLAELFFFGQGGTRHTCLLLIFIEQILERDRCQRLALSFNLHMLFGLYRLMKSVRIAAARHDTPGKLIDDQHFVILNYIVLVFEHQIMGSEGKNDIMLDLQVLRICQVLNMEELLNLYHAVFRQVDILLFLIDDKVSSLLDVFSHDGIHLAEFPAGFAAFQLAGQDVACLVKFGGFSALARYDQRSSGLIDQYGVDLINDGKFQASLYQLLFVDDHIVSQIIEAQLIVGDICDVAVISRTALVVVHAVEYDANGKAKELMHLSHPLGITLSQIIIDRYDMHALACQRVQISRKGGNQSLSFTSLHLSDTPLVEDNAADQLHAVMLHAQGADRCFPNHRICFRKNIIQRLAFCQTLLEFPGLFL